MSLFHKVRTAEHPGREGPRQRFTRAWGSLEEAQSRLRRKMRLRPRSAKPSLPELVPAEDREKQPTTPLPIVTINGEDLAPEEFEASEEHVG